MRISKKDRRKLDRLDFAVKKYNDKIEINAKKDASFIGSDEYYQMLKKKQILHAAQHNIVKKYH